MQQERRRKQWARNTGSGEVTVTLADAPGRTRRVLARAADHSESGLGLTVSAAIDVGANVHVEGTIETALRRVKLNGDAQVRWCVALGDGRYRVGLLLATEPESSRTDYERPNSASPDAVPADSDYYELLQLSPNADIETVNRVFRLLAARYHPDNTETGNAELFRRLVEAHKILSDPERRAAYDAVYKVNQQIRWKIFDNVEVTMGAAAEKRKRAGILSLLYAKRLQQPEQPALSLREMEPLLNCPKEHLEFAVWYLREAGHIVRTDNGRYHITIKGVDEAENSPGMVMADASHMLTAPSASASAA